HPARRTGTFLLAPRQRAAAGLGDHARALGRARALARLDRAAVPAAAGVLRLEPARDRELRGALRARAPPLAGRTLRALRPGALLEQQPPGLEPDPVPAAAPLRPSRPRQPLVPGAAPFRRRAAAALGLHGDDPARLRAAAMVPRDEPACARALRRRARAREPRARRRGLTA